MGERSYPRESRSLRCLCRSGSLLRSRQCWLLLHQFDDNQLCRCDDVSPFSFRMYGVKHAIDENMFSLVETAWASDFIRLSEMGTGNREYPSPFLTPKSSTKTLLATRRASPYRSYFRFGSSMNGVAHHLNIISRDSDVPLSVPCRGQICPVLTVDAYPGSCLPKTTDCF